MPRQLFRSPPLRITSALALLAILLMAEPAVTERRLINRTGAPRSAPIT